MKLDPLVVKIAADYSDLSEDTIEKIHSEEIKGDYGVSILVIIAVIGLIIQIAPIVIDWWRNRGVLSRIRVTALVRRSLLERDDKGKGISAFKLSNSIIDVINKNPKLADNYAISKEGNSE